MFEKSCVLLEMSPMFEFEELNRDMAPLPVTAQQLVVDLVAFLKQRYCQLDSAAPQQINPENQAFVRMWSDCLERRDSTAWVRQVRQQHWHSR
jgi:hypothetical protein